MRMDNLVLAVTITIGLILAGTHTTTAQCEFCDTVFPLKIRHATNSPNFVRLVTKKKEVNALHY